MAEFLQSEASPDSFNLASATNKNADHDPQFEDADMW